jgi:hypothetical protein
MGYGLVVGGKLVSVLLLGACKKDIELCIEKK